MESNKPQNLFNTNFFENEIFFNKNFQAIEYMHMYIVCWALSLLTIINHVSHYDEHVQEWHCVRLLVIITLSDSGQF